MYPSDDASIRNIGINAARLLLAGPSWITRRKERIELLDETAVRRRMSVDFELPPTVQPVSQWLDRQVWYAPLFFLQKGSDEPFDPDAELRKPEPHFANFDFRDESGRALSLPPRTWNAAVTGYMLSELIDHGLREKGKARVDLVPGIDAIAHELCSADQLRAVRLLEQLRAGKGFNGKQLTTEEGRVYLLDAIDPFTARMLNVCAVASVLMVPRTGPNGRRGILKLSYDHEITPLDGRLKRVRPTLASTGLHTYELWVDTPYVGAAQHHFEMQAPDGLEIVDAGLIRLRRGAHAVPNLRANKSKMLDRASGFATRLHLYASPATDAADVMAYVRLRVRRHEFVGGAVVAGVLVAAVLWAGYLLRHDIARTPLAVPTLLLLFPSLIAAYVARPAPHRITHRLLRGARWVVGFAGVLPFVAAGMLALTPRTKTGELQATELWTWWHRLALAATVLTAILAAARVFPVPEIRVRKLTRPFRAAWKWLAVRTWRRFRRAETTN